MKKFNLVGTWIGASWGLISSLMIYFNYISYNPQTADILMKIFFFPSIVGTYLTVSFKLGFPFSYIGIYVIPLFVGALIGFGINNIVKRWK